MALSILDKYHPGVTDPQNYTQGRDVGKAFGGLAKIGTDIYQGYQADKAKSKVDELVQEYNGYMSALQNKEKNPPHSIYSGMDASTATEKIARLLLPWDKDMAAKYSAKADQMGTFDREQAGKEALKDKEIQAAKEKAENPEEARNRLRISRDVAYNKSATATTSEAKKMAEREVAILTREMARSLPSTQDAYAEIDKLYGGAAQSPEDATAGTGEEKKELTPYQQLEAKITDEMGKIATKGQTLTTAVAALKDLVNKAALTPDEKKTLTTSIDLAKDGKPAGKGKTPVEDKDSFTAFKQGNDKNLATVAASLALGDSMKGILEAYKPGEKLTVDDSQKLAALYYQTYNPGTLVASEMSSAVSSLKNPNANAFQSGWNELRNKFGLTDNRIPLDVAIKTYNKGLETGTSAYARAKKALDLYKEKKASDYSLTDAFMTGFANPESYTVGGSGGAGSGTDELVKVKKWFNDKGYTYRGLNSVGKHFGKDKNGRIVFYKG